LELHSRFDSPNEAPVMTVAVLAVDAPQAPACPMPDRFRHDVTYFATPAGVQDAPAQLADGEYWIRADDARRILDEGVITIVSPLDSRSRTELEITEDQERWLEWLLQHRIQHVRLVGQPRGP
jgi:hypothetical protein